ncbi:hypothetical protein GCM10023085_28300 [Actinomadura viridis]|uniref:DUF6542 domain-containing protein n=1 Tax=Actinomadura viridis TaxID=58110 RepID=A0A931GPA0_9ACTN|nr:DUF6542 domain-containing protein [Actinomadura viridis]MBG6087184.1 hypothetical protein [Actinomadura viridis]
MRRRRDRARKDRARRDPAAAPAGGPVTLTGRGGVVVLFAAGLLGALLSRWLDAPVLAGAGFATGCVLAALATRPADLLPLAVSPPVVFLAVTILAELVTGIGEDSLLRSVAVGVLAALAATAPWLFGGTLLVLVITVPRGLLANVRELRGRLAGSRLFEQEENENPVRWEEPPSTARTRRREPQDD